MLQLSEIISDKKEPCQHLNASTDPNHPEFGRSGTLTMMTSVLGFSRGFPDRPSHFVNLMVRFVDCNHKFKFMLAFTRHVTPEN